MHHFAWFWLEEADDHGGTDARCARPARDRPAHAGAPGRRIRSDHPAHGGQYWPRARDRRLADQGGGCLRRRGRGADRRQRRQRRWWSRGAAQVGRRAVIAALEAARAGLFRREHWTSNIVAGVIVGVVALPLAMAFAIASGVKPEQGLYTAIIAGVAVSLFGGSRVQIAGPTGAFIVILAGVVAQFGVSGLLVATLMAGVILVVMGLARLGSVIRFIPDPVIVGFTAGIAVIIWVGQWQYFFGLPTAGEGPFYLKAWQLLGAFPQLHPATALLGLGSLGLVLYGPRIPGMARVPGPLLAMIAA